MVEETTILQHWIFSKFVFPFLLMFAITFAILEKTKVLGSDKKQLNAIVAFVIGMIFVSAVYPKIVVTNLILFLTVSLVVVFVILLLWGFVSGSEMNSRILDDKIKWLVGIVVVLAGVVAVFWATGISDRVFNFLFNQTWSGTFWTNFLFVVVVAVALALVYKGTRGASSSSGGK